MQTFSAYWILHIGTLLSFSKLIPSLIYMQVCLEEEDAPVDVVHIAYMLLRAISLMLLYCIVLSCIYYSCIIIFGTRIHVSTICQVDVISGRIMYFQILLLMSCITIFETRIHALPYVRQTWYPVVTYIYIFFLYCLFFWRYDNPALWVCTPRHIYVHVHILR